MHDGVSVLFMFVTVRIPDSGCAERVSRRDME